MKRLLPALAVAASLLAGGATRIVQDQCGPFTDVSPTLCPYVLEVYYLGITAGTSATTFSPDATLTRGQAAVFVSKTIDRTLARSSRRAALGQWWNTQNQFVLGGTTLGVCAGPIASDGTDLWVNDNVSCGGGARRSIDPIVTRLSGSDGRVLEIWGGVFNSYAMLVAMGRVFLASLGYPGIPPNPGTPGNLYMLDPSQPPGDAVNVATLGSGSIGMAFDGDRIWVVNRGDFFTQGPSLSIVTPAPSPPWPVTTTPLKRGLSGIVFDGTNVWITDNWANVLVRLDSTGAVVQTVTVAPYPEQVLFDGANLWVSSAGEAMTIVQAATGNVLASLSGGALAFDGERVLVENSSAHTLSLWRAADLSLIGTFPTPGPLNGVCSDGLNFWLGVSGNFPTPVQIVRF